MPKTQRVRFLQTEQFKTQSVPKIERVQLLQTEQLKTQSVPKIERARLLQTEQFKTQWGSTHPFSQASRYRPQRRRNTTGKCEEKLWLIGLQIPKDGEVRAIEKGGEKRL